MADFNISKKLQDLLQDKMVQSKLNQAIDMLKKGDSKELAEKMEKVDKNELMSKINEYDEERIKNLKLDKEEIKKKLDQADLNKLEKLLGKDSDAIMKKVNDFLKS